MTLLELTNHEAGIICYGGNTVAVVNWGQCGDDELPVQTPIGTMIPWEDEEGIIAAAEATYRRVADIREELPGKVWLTDETDENGNHLCDTDLDIVEDPWSDIPRLFLGVDFRSGELLKAWDYEGVVYELADGRKIIAPDMWN